MYTIIYDGGYLDTNMWKTVYPSWLSCNPSDKGIVRNRIVKNMQRWIENLEGNRYIDHYLYLIITTARICKVHMGIERILFEKDYMVSDLLDEHWKLRYDAVVEKFKEEV